MNQRQLFATASLLTISAVGTSSSMAAQANRADSLQPQVRTVASAIRNVTPNLAIVRLNFTAVGRSAKQAGRKLAARADSLRRALVSLGLSRDSLVTASDWY